MKISIIFIRRKLFCIICFVISAFHLFAQDNRWPEEKANNWYKSFKWFNGVNYIPSDAINYTAMWDKTSFKPYNASEIEIIKSLNFSTRK
jgi:hypothetical protein